MSLLVAIGGNAVHPDNIRGTTEEQERIAERAAQALLPLAAAADQLLITHGNGPVVGKILLRMMLTRDAIPPMRLDVCVAHSQGGIGYMLMQALENALARAGNPRQSSCVVTEVEVDANDPAFGAASKPIGPFFSEAEARDFEKKGWRMMEDAGRGWRHCVPSPEPRKVINLGVIRALLDAGVLVIAGGGGGIPVTRNKRGEWAGVEVAGRFAREALAAGEGEVCAVFRRSFYLRFPGNRYACVGDATLGRGPLNVLVEDLQMPALGERVSLALAQVQSWAPPPAPAVAVPDVGALQHAARGRAPREGLGGLVIDEHNALSGHAQPALDAIEGWLVGNAIDEEAQALIGLGPGLTPSGDD